MVLHRKACASLPPCVPGAPLPYALVLAPSALIATWPSAGCAAMMQSGFVWSAPSGAMDVKE